MEQTGTVTAVHGEYLEITFCRPTECEHCHGCMGGSAAERKLTVRGKASVGDGAVVELPAGQIMKASAIAYAIPLAALLIGMVLGTVLFPQVQNAAAAIGGLALMGVSLLGIRLTEKTRRKSGEWQPVLVRVIPLADLAAAK